MHDPLSTLRTIVYDGPSEEGWTALCAYLDTWECPSSLHPVMLSFLTEHLSVWPKELRTPPQSWRQRLFSEPNPPPWWNIVAAYDVWMPSRRQIIQLLLAFKEYAHQDTYAFSLQHASRMLENFPTYLVCAVGYSTAKALCNDLTQRGECAEVRLHDLEALKDPARQWGCSIEINCNLSQDQRNFARHAFKWVEDMEWAIVRNSSEKGPRAADLFWAQDTIHMHLEDKREHILHALSEIRAFGIELDTHIESRGIKSL